MTDAPAPISAIHSRNAETAISRPMITVAMMETNHRGSALTIRTSAAATINLSATGSRNAPRREVRPSLRAK